LENQEVAVAKAKKLGVIHEIFYTITKYKPIKCVKPDIETLNSFIILLQI